MRTPDPSEGPDHAVPLEDASSSAMTASLASLYKGEIPVQSWNCNVGSQLRSSASVSEKIRHVDSPGTTPGKQGLPAREPSASLLPPPSP